MKFLITILFFTFSSLTFGLGLTGHRVTGEIAQRHLLPHTQIALKAIIGNETLAQVSTYPDEMRSSPNKFWNDTARPYHYVTVPKGKTYQQVGAPKQGDAVFALNKFSKIVKSKNSSKSEKSDAIKLIVHIIGDLHQPLHAGNGLDYGGNDIKIKFYGKDTNLHRIWDTDLIEREHLSFTEWTNWLDNDISQSDIKKWRTNDPLVWIKESVIIRDKIYPKSDSIGYTYQYENMPIIKLRLKQAGVRIAYYLDELLK